MKVSVVIPAYNEEEYIGRTLSAALRQDYPDYEIIVVDNASTDRTAEIVRQFPDVRLVYESRKGTQFARERGRLSASGDIVATLDADCLPPSNWISSGVSRFSNNKIIAVTGPCYYYDMNFLFSFASLWLQKIVYKIFHAVLSAAEIGAVIIASNTFARAEVLKKAGGFNTSMAFYGDDTDTAQRLMPHGRIMFANSMLMPTSGRRFQKQGIISTFAIYLYHFFYITFKRRYQRLAKKISK
jgi:glycosyltransferase involved in cell wall biosynthesis